MRALAVLLAAVAAVGLGAVYTVTDAQQFFFTYYKAKPGDTIILACDVIKPMTLDHGGTIAKPVVVMGKDGQQTIGQPTSTIQVTANSLQLVNLELNAPLEVKGNNVLLKQITTKKHNIKIMGNSCTVQDSHIVFDYYTQMTLEGQKNTIINNTLEWECRYYGMIDATTNSTKVISNKFRITGRDGCVDTRVIHEKAGSSKNMYAFNDVVYTQSSPTSAVFVYVDQDPGNDHICTSNTISDGKNIGIDQHC